MAEYKTIIITNDDDFKRQIKEHFKEHKLPMPKVIKKTGKWGMGDVYAVTAGVFKNKRFCVYEHNGLIHSVRRR